MPSSSERRNAFAANSLNSMSTVSFEHCSASRAASKQTFDQTELGSMVSGETAVMRMKMNSVEELAAGRKEKASVHSAFQQLPRKEYHRMQRAWWSESRHQGEEEITVLEPLHGLDSDLEEVFAGSTNEAVPFVASHITAHPWAFIIVHGLGVLLFIVRFAVLLRRHACTTELLKCLGQISLFIFLGIFMPSWAYSLWVTDPIRRLLHIRHAYAHNAYREFTMADQKWIHKCFSKVGLYYECVRPFIFVLGALLPITSLAQVFMVELDAMHSFETDRSSIPIWLIGILWYGPVAVFGVTAVELVCLEATESCIEGLASDIDHEYLEWQRNGEPLLAPDGPDGPRNDFSTKYALTPSSQPPSSYAALRAAGSCEDIDDLVPSVSQRDLPFQPSGSLSVSSVGGVVQIDWASVHRKFIKFHEVMDTVWSIPNAGGLRLLRVLVLFVGTLAAGAQSVQHPWPLMRLCFRVAAAVYALADCYLLLSLAVITLKCSDQRPNSKSLVELALSHGGRQKDDRRAQADYQCFMTYMLRPMIGIQILGIPITLRLVVVIFGQFVVSFQVALIFTERVLFPDNFHKNT